MPLFHLSNIRVPLVHAFPPGTRGVFAHCPVVWIMSRCIKWKGLDSFISTGSCLLERMCISTPHFTDADYVQDAVLGEGHWETGCCHGGRLIAKHVPSIHSLLVRGAILLPLVFLRAIHESLKEKKAKWSTFRSSGAWVRLVELKCSITDHGGWRGFISQRYVVGTWPVWPAWGRPSTCARGFGTESARYHRWSHWQRTESHSLSKCSDLRNLWEAPPIGGVASSIPRIVHFRSMVLLVLIFLFSCNFFIYLYVYEWYTYSLISIFKSSSCKCSKQLQFLNC